MILSFRVVYMPQGGMERRPVQLMTGTKITAHPRPKAVNRRKNP